MNEPDPEERVRSLRGEWSEISGGDLAVRSTTWQGLAPSRQVDADLVVFLSRYLGEFCTRGWLRPLRIRVLESKTLDYSDFPTRAKRALQKWGRETDALPLRLDRNAVATSDNPPTAMTLLVDAAPRAVLQERIGVLFAP